MCRPRHRRYDRPAAASEPGIDRRRDGIERTMNRRSSGKLALIHGGDHLARRPGIKVEVPRADLFGKHFMFSIKLGPLSLTPRLTSRRVLPRPRHDRTLPSEMQCARNRIAFDGG